MPSPAAVLFDLDGTLIDSIDLIVDSYLHVFSTHGIPPLTREALIEGIGTPLWTVFGTFTTDRATIDRWIVTYREFNLAQHDTRVRAFPGVVPVLRSIHASGRPLGLVTSKSHSGAERGLALIGARALFSVIVGADDVAQPKPHPEPVLRALELLDASADSAWYIGDSHHDITAGNAAGTRTVGVTWGPLSRARLEAAGASRICTTPEELLTVLGIAAGADPDPDPLQLSAFGP